MCLAFPGKIISLKNKKAIVDFGRVKKEINVSLIKAKLGDFVNVHAGFAIQKLIKKDAFAIFDLYEKSEKSSQKNK